jgi:hypothetical protein
MVPSAYRIRANRDVAIVLSHYDSAAPLVIDPVISFAGYWGGSGADAPVGIAVDRNGYVYLAGNTVSSDFPTTASGVDTSNAGLQDVWLMKLNPAASWDQMVMYSSFYGGTGTDVVKAMTIDPDGLFYIAGSTTSTNLPLSDRAFQQSNAGTTDAFVAWFDPTQSGGMSLLYATYMGGAAVDEASGIATLDRKIYVTGSTLSDNFPTANPYAARSAARDIFVAEIAPELSGSASLVASTYFGGSGTDYGRTIAVDAPGHVYVAGLTYSRDFPLSSSATQSAYAGGGDAFLAEFDLSHAQGGYSSYLGGSGTDDAKKIVIDSAGRIALTGYTSSADFAITQNAAQPLLGGTGAVNAFLTLLDTRAPASQAVVYSTYFGGSVAEVASDLKRDATGKYYLGGYSFSPDMPVSQNTLNPIAGTGGLNGFLAVIDPSAPPVNAFIYSSYVTGPGSQTVNGVAVANGAIYVTGSATGDIFPSGLQSHTVGHDADAFVLIFTP